MNEIIIESFDGASFGHGFDYLIEPKLKFGQGLGQEFGHGFGFGSELEFDHRLEFRDGFNFGYRQESGFGFGYEKEDQW
ncbi:MAG: hypothetical protein KZQ59_12315 [Candidatus Thiodiazotropha sp. (ex Lucinoma aequizonata)]|nr:hypothetical protein [Candidatus Thiodiazotropha sp. (ex Lucinoma aequizonata)]